VAEIPPAHSSRAWHCIVFWALVFVPLTRMALRIFGYRHWQDLLFLAVPPVCGDEVRPELISEARRAARLIRAAATEGLARGRCLEQSVVLRWLL